MDALNNKPKIFGYCPAGCKWETVHKDDFERSASIIRLNPDENGYYYLESGKEYKIFADKDSENNFTCTVEFLQNDGKSYSIDLANEDKYAESFTFRLLETIVHQTSGNQLSLVYELAGARYATVMIGLFNLAAIRVTGATSVCLYNADATIYGEKGESVHVRYSAYEDGTDFTDTWASGHYYIGVATGKEAPTDKSGYTWIPFISLEPSTLVVTHDSEGNVTLDGAAKEIEVPVFNLVERGLPTLYLDADFITARFTTTDIITAIRGGAVKFIVNVDYGDGSAIDVECLTTNAVAGSGHICSCVTEVSGKTMLLVLTIINGAVMAELKSIDSYMPAMPAFDLGSLGLPNVPTNGKQVSVTVDTTEIRAALDEGLVKFTVPFVHSSELTFDLIMSKNRETSGIYCCSSAFEYLSKPVVLNLLVSVDVIVAYIYNLAETEPVATSIDMTAFDSAGQITETYKDGTTKTTTIEFDESGNPVKIVDGDGNETTLTW